MGIDYYYAGSAGYPRFSEEVCSVAKIFGGTKIKPIDSNKIKYIFPYGTNEILVKWFNNIYGELNREETKVVWEHVSAHPEIQEVSSQIWYELGMLVRTGEGWSIY